MSLNDLKDGQDAIIKEIKATKELHSRLLSFGFMKNKKLKKIHSSLKKATIMIEFESTCVILRSNEAKTIEVEPI